MSGLKLWLHRVLRFCDKPDIVRPGGHRLEAWRCPVCGRLWWVLGEDWVEAHR